MKSNSNKMVHVQINVDTCHTRAHNTITIPVYMTYIIWLQLINCAWICFSRCNIGYFNCHDELVVSGATWPGPAHCDRQLKALHDNGIDTWLWSGVNYQDLNLDPRIGAEGWEIPALHDYAVQFLLRFGSLVPSPQDRSPVPFTAWYADRISIWETQGIALTGVRTRDLWISKRVVHHCAT